MSEDRNKRSLAARGADTEEMWSHAIPEKSASRLRPALLHYDSVVVEKLPSVVTSWDTMALLESKGATLTQIPFRYYRDMLYQGVNRRLDNSDWIKGKTPLYEDLQSALSIADDIKGLVLKMMHHYDPERNATLLASMEMQDLPKVTAQQWKPTGWFCESPVTDAEVPDKLSPTALSVLNAVAGEYGRILKTTEFATMSWQDLTLLDTDPDDTMTGAPTYAAGEQTHTARLAIMAALEPPARTPEEFVQSLDALGSRLGFPERVVYSPVVSTRMGPLKKPVKLFVREEGGYIARYQSVGAYNRTRFVFPAPYYVNFLLSPLYVQMSEVRTRKLGLWHDPESQDKYLAVLRKQGKFAYSIDFSGMDTAMWPSIIMPILAALKKNGFSQWSARFFEALYPKMGVVLPDYGGSTQNAMLLTGSVRPWCSGFKLTSEFDTIYGAAVLLTALQEQIPDIVERWISGQFVFLELGDDIMFTSDVEINAELLQNSALTQWGAKLEIIQDAMFLKWFLPVVPEIPKLTRSFARFIQQTFFNEDRYDGVEGGVRPPAVMRLGLMARLEGLINHPDFSKWWTPCYEILCKLEYVKVATSEYRERLRQGIPSLDEGDPSEIVQYSLRIPSYFNSLIDRAKFEPSAAHALRLMKELGLDMQLNPASAEVRKLYLSELMRKPTSRDFENLFQFTQSFSGA